MDANTEFIGSGTVTSPEGFHAGAAFAGIKKKADKASDIGVLYAGAPCAAAALFTTNKIKSAPVVLSRERLKSGRAAAVVVNSGCANACTGEQGLADAAEMARLAAGSIGAVAPEDVLVASTGVIGHPLPMGLIRNGIEKIALSADGGHELARAIMTTDTVPKEAAVRAGGFVIGGIAKGSGMIHPDLATMLCFLTTDAAVEVDFLRSALAKAAAVSFNMISIDGDTSPSDTVLIMANGRAGGEPIAPGSGRADIFQQALEKVCIYLAKAIARDGEGATRLIEVTVKGAASVAEARLAARTVAGSSLVKAAVHGRDPNWGRMVVAAGRSGAEVDEARVELYIGDTCVFRAGRPQPFDNAGLVRVLGGEEVSVSLNLNLGAGEATAWGCDLTEEYVTINSQYTT